MAQWLGVHVAFVEDPSSFLAPTERLTTTVTRAPGD